MWIPSRESHTAPHDGSGGDLRRGPDNQNHPSPADGKSRTRAWEVVDF